MSNLNFLPSLTLPVIFKEDRKSSQHLSGGAATIPSGGISPPCDVTEGQHPQPLVIVEWAEEAKSKSTDFLSVYKQDEDRITTFKAPKDNDL